MVEAWRNQIIMQLQMDGELSLNAAARVDLFDGEEDGSPLIECVVEGELSSEALVSTVARVTTLPRLDWSMVPYQVIRDEFELNRDTCLRYRIVPLRYVPGSHVDVAMVDPSWVAAHEVIDELYGLPRRLYVISYTDFIFITRPELAPPVPFAEDELDTVRSVMPPEVLELLKAFDRKMNEGPRGRGVPNSTLEFELSASRSLSVDSLRVEDVFTSNDRGISVELALLDDDLEFLKRAPEHDVQNTEDFGKAAESVVEVAEAGFKESDTDPAIRLAEAPALPNFDEVHPPFDDAPVPKSEKRMVDSAAANANSVIGTMIHMVLASPPYATVWSDITELANLIARGTARYVAIASNGVVLDATFDGASVGDTTRMLIEEMMVRSVISVTHRSQGPVVFSLLANTRAERSILSYYGESTLFVGEKVGPETYSVFGLLGVVSEHREVGKRLVTFLSERTKLLEQQVAEAELKLVQRSTLS